MPLRWSGKSSPSRVSRRGIRRKMPWCAPRNSNVMSSRTMRLPSALTTRLVMKLSIENSPRVCATAGDAAASTSASAARLRPMRSAPERDARDLTVVGAVEVELEVCPLDEAEEQRDLVGRKAVDRRVEIADDGVVVAARALDRFLELAQRGLQLEEALVRLEVGIRLGEREELAQRPRQLVLGLRARLRRLRRHGRAAGADDLVERGPLVRGVALDGLDQVGNQVRPALELDVDVRPRLLGPLAQADELVVRDDNGDDETDEDEEKNDATQRHNPLPRHRSIGVLRGWQTWARGSFFEVLVSSERGAGRHPHSQEWQRAEMPQDHA